MNTRLHAITDANGHPLSFFMTAGQISDYIGAAALLDELPKTQWLLADRGCFCSVGWPVPGTIRMTGNDVIWGGNGPAGIATADWRLSPIAVQKLTEHYVQAKSL